MEIFFIRLGKGRAVLYSCDILVNSGIQQHGSWNEYLTNSWISLRKLQNRILKGCALYICELDDWVSKNL